VAWRDRREAKDPALVHRDVGHAHVVAELVLACEAVEEAVEVWIA
jgi:hypothetical protein